MAYKNKRILNGGIIRERITISKIEGERTVCTGNTEGLDSRNKIRLLLGCVTKIARRENAIAKIIVSMDWKKDGFAVKSLNRRNFTVTKDGYILDVHEYERERIAPQIKKQQA